MQDLIITPGQTTQGGDSWTSARPHRLAVTITTAAGKKVQRELTLDRGTGGQHRNFPVEEATAVRFTVKSAYEASDAFPVAIDDIEFFGPPETLKPVPPPPESS